MTAEKDPARKREEPPAPRADRAKDEDPPDAPETEKDDRHQFRDWALI